MLTISIRSLPDNKSIDVKVNDRQKISNTLSVLKDAGFLKQESRVTTIRSKRNRKRIEINKSYQDNKIFNGDILTLEYTDDK